MTTNDELKEFLGSSKLFVLSVVTDDGSPWVTPLTIKKWQGHQIEWDSAVSTVHSQAIAREPRVALCVFKKEGDKQVGFYASANAQMIEDKEDGFARYSAIIDRAWLNDEDFVKRELDTSILDGLGA